MEKDLKVVQEMHRKEAASKRQKIKDMKLKERQVKRYGEILIEVCPYVLQLSENELRLFLEEML